MTHSSTKQTLGIIGCGAIGSRIALSVKKELKSSFTLAGLYDIDPAKTCALSRKVGSSRLIKQTPDELISSCDMVVECVNTDATTRIVQKTLKANKSILVMSVGRVLGQDSLFSLLRRSKGSFLVPSGAIGGLDAIKAASLAGITSATLTTTKPPKGFAGNQQVEKLTKAKMLFSGSVSEAVKRFPQNINVSAALALAIGNTRILKVCIMADPAVHANTHEICIKGAFGCLNIKVENKPCPDNPKTSYLAVLSAIQTLRQHASNVKIGT